MKYFIIILILSYINCNPLSDPIIVRCASDESYDSLFRKYEWDGDGSYWIKPIYPYYASYNGAHYYRINDTIIRAWKDTIFMPALTGWKTSPTYNPPGYKIELPYFKDSLTLVKQNMGSDPLYDVGFVRALPYYCPKMWPHYVVEERCTDANWMGHFPYWPETPIDNKGNIAPRIDSAGPLFNIGDIVDLIYFNFPNYYMKFMIEHENDTLWTNNEKYRFMRNKKYPGNYDLSYGKGIIKGYRIDNKVRYYEVMCDYNNNTSYHFWHKTYKVAEELKHTKEK